MKMRNSWGLRDQKGFTLVELLCAIAILTVVGTVIGMLVVTATKHYQNSMTETTVQQEAQFTANRIAGLMKDVTQDVRYYYYAEGNLTEAETEEEITTEDGKDRLLEIVNAEEDNSYAIVYHAAEETLMYYESMGAEQTTQEQLLAEHVTLFAADVSDFDEHRMVTITLGFTIGTKTYDMTYHMTSRNGAVEVKDAIDTKWASIQLTPAEFILEPSQDYFLKVEVKGTTQGFSCALTGNMAATTAAVEKQVTQEGENQTGIRIKVDKRETGDENGNLYLTIKTNEKMEDGVTPLATRVAIIHVRRVESIDLKMTLMSGEDLQKDAEYQINAKVMGNYLDQKWNAAYDEDYVSPYSVAWEFTYQIMETEVSFADYFEIVEEKEDVTLLAQEAPYVVLRLKKDMAGQSRLTVKATAKHAEGIWESAAYNKTGIKYDTVTQEVTLEQVEQGNRDPVTGSKIDLKRGQDYWFDISKDNYGTVLDEAASKGGQLRWFYRYREIGADGVGGMWTKYMATIESSPAKKLNAVETTLFLPDRGYEIEIIPVRCQNNQIYWPQNDALLAEGTGLESFVKSGWSTTQTPESDYVRRYVVDKVSIVFADFNGYTGGSNLGSAQQPVQINQMDVYLSYRVDNLEAGHFQNDFRPILQKWEEETGTWVTDTSDLTQLGTRGWRIERCNHDTLMIRYDQNVQKRERGLYRIGIYMQSSSFKYLSQWSLYQPQYQTLQNQIFNLYDQEADIGYLYLQMNY